MNANEAEIVALEALVKEYRQHFGQEPDWWALHIEHDDMAQALREAIRTGKPIVLNISPDCDA